MTKEEIELIADRVADKVVERLKGACFATGHIVDAPELPDVKRAELFSKQQQLQRMRDRLKDGWQTLRQEKYE
jgi:hypothetical protein